MNRMSKNAAKNAGTYARKHRGADMKSTSDPAYLDVANALIATYNRFWHAASMPEAELDMLRVETSADDCESCAGPSDEAVLFRALRMCDALGMFSSGAGGGSGSFTAQVGRCDVAQLVTRELCDQRAKQRSGDGIDSSSISFAGFHRILCSIALLWQQRSSTNSKSGSSDDARVRLSLCLPSVVCQLATAMPQMRALFAQARRLDRKNIERRSGGGHRQQQGVSAEALVGLVDMLGVKDLDISSAFATCASPNVNEQGDDEEHRTLTLSFIGFIDCIACAALLNDACATSKHERVAVASPAQRITSTLSRLRSGMSRAVFLSYSRSAVNTAVDVDDEDAVCPLAQFLRFCACCGLFGVGTALNFASASEICEVEDALDTAFVCYSSPESEGVCTSQYLRMLRDVGVLHEPGVTLSMALDARKAVFKDVEPDKEMGHAVFCAVVRHVMKAVFGDGGNGARAALHHGLRRLKQQLVKQPHMAASCRDVVLAQLWASEADVRHLERLQQQALDAVLAPLMQLADARVQCYLGKLRAAGASIPHTNAITEGLLDTLRIVSVLPLLPETDARDCIMATLQVVVSLNASNASSSWAAFGMSGLFELMGRVALLVNIPADAQISHENAAARFEWLLHFLQRDQNATVVLGNISMIPKHRPLPSTNEVLDIPADQIQDGCTGTSVEGTCKETSPQGASDVHSLIESELHAALAHCSDNVSVADVCEIARACGFLGSKASFIDVLELAIREQAARSTASVGADALVVTALSMDTVRAVLDQLAILAHSCRWGALEVMAAHERALRVVFDRYTREHAPSDSLSLRRALFEDGPQSPDPTVQTAEKRLDGTAWQEFTLSFGIVPNLLNSDAARAVFERSCVAPWVTLGFGGFIEALMRTAIEAPKQVMINGSREVQDPSTWAPQHCLAALSALFAALDAAVGGGIFGKMKLSLSPKSEHRSVRSPLHKLWRSSSPSNGTKFEFDNAVALLKSDPEALRTLFLQQRGLESLFRRYSDEHTVNGTSDDITQFSMSEQQWERFISSHSIFSEPWVDVSIACMSFKPLVFSS
eukprot:g1342.t1